MSKTPQEQTTILDELTEAALAGDASQAKATLGSLASIFEVSCDGPVWLSARDRKFLAVALRRVAADSAAVNVVCAASKHKGRKEKTGRPTESYKALNVALTVARHGSVKKAMAAAAHLSWFPKNRRDVERMWKAHRDTAERMLAESGD